MELMEFLEGIRLMPEAIEKVQNLSVSKTRYECVRQMFYEDKSRFYEEILKEQNYRIWFLYYYSRMASELYEVYQEKGIEETVFWDTFYDLTLWCQNCYRDYGEYGIQEYQWIPLHLELRIFRFGRLQFELVQLGNSISDGNPFVNIHIPQGESLDMESCRKSFERAFEIYGKNIMYQCDSWLLNPVLQEMLNKDSNIIKFQKLFEESAYNPEERQAEERIFDRVEEDANKYPEKTSLQRAAKKYLINGGKMGNVIGRLKVELL